MLAAVWHPSGLSNRSGPQVPRIGVRCNGGSAGPAFPIRHRPPTGGCGSLTRRAVGAPSPWPDHPHRGDRGGRVAGGVVPRPRIGPHSRWCNQVSPACGARPAHASSGSRQPCCRSVAGRSPRTGRPRSCGASSAPPTIRSISLLARNQRVPELVGVEIHRPTRSGRSGAPGPRSGSSVTNPLRMLCDLAAVDPRGMVAAVEQVVIAGLVLPTGAGDSVLEPAMARLLADHGLPPRRVPPDHRGVPVPETDTKRRRDSDGRGRRERRNWRSRSRAIVAGVALGAAAGP